MPNMCCGILVGNSVSIMEYLLVTIDQLWNACFDPLFTVNE